jgi:inosine/guanosine/xanthosine phosphorylase family protein
MSEAPEPRVDPDAAAHAAATIVSAGGRRPRVGLILGSGLGAVANIVTPAARLSYADLPGFPRPGVAGHDGRVTIGGVGHVPVVVLQGRSHYYESGCALGMDVPVRALAAAGCEILVLTNAAGSTDAGVGPGSLVGIRDHLNLSGANPLVGPAPGGAGARARFVDMVNAYDAGLRTVLAEAADEEGITLGEGIYACFSGPSFETPAEVRAVRLLGADLVGMSVVHETIIARHCGLRVVGLSVVTNHAAGIGGDALGHEQTMASAARATGTVARLLGAFLRRLA